MATRNDLVKWVYDALVTFGGGGTIIEVARHIWQQHEADLARSGDLLFTWQYDMRWAAQKLRDEGKAVTELRGGRSYWSLTSRGP